MIIILWNLLTVESTNFHESIKCASKCFILVQIMQNPELVNQRQSQECYLHTTHLGNLNENHIRMGTMMLCESVSFEYKHAICTEMYVWTLPFDFYL